MSVTHRSTLRGLRNTRDLRAEMLGLAAQLSGNTLRACLTVVDPTISEATVQEEWARHLPALAPSVRERLELRIERARPDKAAPLASDSGALPLDRPNYRHEVLRLLLAADLDASAPVPVSALIARVGVSQTPIRQALADLRASGLSRSKARGLQIAAEDLSTELLARVQALPQVLHFRFERGARIKPAAALLERALPLLAPDGPADWRNFALSGAAVALRDVPELDLLGLPRVDLVAHVPREAKTFDAAWLRLLDDGLEPEPSVVAPAPVAVTLVRGNTPLFRTEGPGRTHCAAPVDVFLSLLDMGLRGQALQYAQGMRP